MACRKNPNARPAPPARTYAHGARIPRPLEFSFPHFTGAPDVQQRPRRRQARPIRQCQMGRRDRPATGRLHRHSQQIADVRPRLADARLHGSGRRVDGALGPRAGHPGHDAGGGAPGRPYPADLHRHPGHRRIGRRRLRAAVRAPGQAAGDDRLGRGPRPVEAGAARRQALRSRRRGRRLRDLRLAHQRDGAAGAGPGARALRGADRGLRGIRQLRPARLRRLSCRSHRQAVLGGVSGFGLRQLRAAVVHHVAAGPRRWQPARGRAGGRRALGRCLGHRAVQLPPAAPIA